MDEGEDLLYNIIQINGIVTKVDSSDFTLHYKITCIPKRISDFLFTEGKKITVKEGVLDTIQSQKIYYWIML